MKRLSVVVVAVVLLGGCASAPQPKPTPSTSPHEEQPSAANKLIYFWQVTGTGSTGTVYLQLNESDFTVESDCGIGKGKWLSDGSAFIADIIFGDGKGTCLRQWVAPTSSLRWLTDAKAFVITDTGANLLGVDGSVLASLEHSTSTPAHPKSFGPIRPDHLPNPNVIAAFANPMPLPSTVSIPEDIVGRWVPEGSRPGDDTYVNYAANGSWSYSDYCKRNSGRWVLGNGGRLLSTEGLDGLVACMSQELPSVSWVSAATRVGIVDGSLVFYDAEGVDLGTLVPAASVG
jgi:hypothetical protein